MTAPSERMDRGVRAVLAGNSSGRPLSRRALLRLLGEEDLDLFLPYVERGALGRLGRILTDGRHVVFAVQTREIDPDEPQVSGHALAVFLYIWKWTSEYRVPIPHQKLVEEFTAGHRSASRLVRRALEELERLCWVEEAPGAVGSAYWPTRVGVGSLGPRFLRGVVARSQGREYRPAEVRAFFGLPEEQDSPPPPVSLFDFAAPHPRYDRALRLILRGTGAGSPPTLNRVLRMVQEESLDGLEQYMVTTGMDRFFHLARDGKHVVAVVPAASLYASGSAPMTAVLVVLAVLTWWWELEYDEPIPFAMLTNVVGAGFRDPGRTVRRYLTVLERKGWVERARGGSRGSTVRGGSYRTTALGRAALRCVAGSRGEEGLRDLGEFFRPPEEPAADLAEEPAEDLPAECAGGSREEDQL